MIPSCPNWLRVALICLTVGSFLPQLHRIWAQKTGTGLSLLYILLNLINATEQLTLAFFYTINVTWELDFFVNTPRSIGDWLNLAQLGVVWVLLFIFSLMHPDPQFPIPYRILVAALYLVFGFISLFPVITDALDSTLFHDPNEQSPGFGVNLFAGWNFFIVSPLTTLLSVCSIVPQAIQLRSQLSSPSPDQGMMRIQDCALQGVVFGVLAASWLFRVKI
ncbi:hypothetical protein ASPZODRAFT_76718 [Penicilliopsis zonata CBS 506.65]|uniref:Uncharacterized protein n=1 Tax=Penicilliopsis zonata CBS 506.65 TaxID=1073090 RepID=A0A1L9S5S0_9EURO|nr:hypothetical protein ASPZODRAFT_76718 [Penicilliopsis zonata CBS 506.65]OJJ42505.1 hypothetical protein ASPZODRAFT_76718 [Penicilliopsis zonata CBS 506.65]